MKKKKNNVLSSDPYENPNLTHGERSQRGKKSALQRFMNESQAKQWEKHEDDGYRPQNSKKTKQNKSEYTMGKNYENKAKNKINKKW